MSIMELFDTSNGVGASAATVATTPAARIGSGTAAATAAAAAAAAATKSPLPPAPRAWNTAVNGFKTAPPSTGTGGSAGGGRASLGSVGGAERHGYLSFSEVKVRRVFLRLSVLLHLVGGTLHVSAPPL